ncbi:MAG: Gldg family protein [Clostridia bacterium]|nr:Gldg family protein [Clostridia bacterium]
MKAVFKRKLSSLLHGVFGPLLIAVSLLSAGLLFCIFQLLLQSPEPSYTHHYLLLVLAVLFPLLTIRSFTADNRLPARDLLYSLPIPLHKIIIGKFLGLLPFLAPAALLVSLFPIILSFYGTVSFGAAYLSVLQFLILSCALLAISCFLSSLMSSYVLAAVLNAGAVALLFFADRLASELPSAPVFSFVLILFLICLAGLLVYLLSASIRLSAVTGGVLLAAAVLLFCLRPQLFTGLLPALLNKCAVFAQFKLLVYGLFDWGNLVLNVVSVPVFLLLAAAVSYRRRYGYPAFRRHTGRSPALSRFSSAAVLSAAILLSAGMVFLHLSPALTRADISSGGFYTVPENAKAALGSLENDVTLYLLTPDGRDNDVMMTFLERYAALSGRIRVQKADLNDADFLAANGIAGASASSILVSSAKRSSLVDFSNLYLYYCPELEQVFSITEYATYASALAEYGYTVEEKFQGAYLLTNAVIYCAADDLPCVCFLLGHGETQPSDLMLGLLDDQAIRYRGLDLLTEGSVPQDCCAVVLFGPAADLTEDELFALQNYLREGGALLAMTDYETVTEMPRLLSLMESWGMETLAERTFNIVMETDENYYLSTQYPFIIRVLPGRHPSIAPVSDSVMVCCAGHPVVPKENADGLTVTSLFLTTSTAYVSSFDDLEGDDVIYSDEGIVSVGAIAEDPSGGRVIWIGSSYAFLDEFSQYSGYGNYVYLSSMLSWMCGDSVLSFEDDIEPVPTVGQLIVPYSAVTVWGILLIALLPCAIILAGAIGAVRRKRQ